MLLIACSAITTISAQQKGKQDNVPYNVKALFHSIITAWGEPNDVYSVNKNPETNQIESSVRITTFSADNDKFPHMAGKVYLNTSIISDAFKKDEPKSYQILHITPGDFKKFSLKAVNEDGQSETYQIRNNDNEEMWLMCCKNPQNPKLRDAYAIKWVITKEETKVNGVIYQITSLRPDYYEKNMSSASILSDNKNTFTIDGRVGYDLKDSLYVVYMADNAEELNNVKDSDFVATMPVVNKRFSFSVQLDKPKVGRIRTVMPDGSLCELWTNLDFVPGETYRITTHNGYYDEDRDYEQRVGRYSGKSLLNDLQRRGIDDQTVVVTDEVPEEFVVVEDGDVVVNGVRVIEPEPDNFNDFSKTISPQQQAEMMLKAKSIEAAIKKVKASYEPLGGIMRGDMGFALANSKMADQVFENIMESNKDLDKKFQEFQKALLALNPPAQLRLSFFSEAYKEILQTFTEQNKGFTEIFAKTGKLSKAAQKTQKYINSVTEKYMKEMMKGLR